MIEIDLKIKNLVRIDILFLTMHSFLKYHLCHYDIIVMLILIKSLNQDVLAGTCGIVNITNKAPA